MIITKEILCAKNACQEGLDYFNYAWPAGGEYQSVIDQCVVDEQIDYATWLIDNIGPTKLVDAQWRSNNEQ